MTSSIAQDKFFEKGFYFDGIGSATHALTTDPSPYTLFGIGLKIGNKWHFGSGEVYRPGVQATWIRAQAFFGSETQIALMSPLNVAFANAFKISDKLILESNLNAGYAYMSMSTHSGTILHNGSGILTSLETKLTHENLSFGFDYSLVLIPSVLFFRTTHFISLTIGQSF